MENNLKYNNSILFLEAVQNYGGARISTLELAKRLEKNNKISIVDFYGSCVPFVKAVKDASINLNILDKRDEPYIISSSRYKIFNILNRIFFIPHWIRLRYKFKKLIKSERPELIMVNNYKTLFLVSFLNIKNVKIVFFARGWFVPHKISLFKRFLLKKTVDKFICVSESTRQALYCGKISALENMMVVHNGIDEEKLIGDVAEINKDCSDIVILHSGGFLAEKGQHISIEVAKALKEEGVKFHLVLTGLIYKGFKSQQYHKMILNLIKRYDLENFVTVITNKTNVISYFRACDVLIHPSSTEGLPRVIMEAMILRKPVIANAVGGVTDYILSGFTGYLTNFNHVKDYVKFIKKLKDNKDHYRFISDNAYSLIKNCYTEESQLEEFNRIINK